MNTVLALAPNVPGGLIDILLVCVLLLAAILLIIAFFLIRSSRRTINKHAYEQQAAMHRLQDAPYQDVGMQQSAPTTDDKQALQAWSPSGMSQPLSPEGEQLKQCPFCGTEVLPGGIFCLYCGQRLPMAEVSASKSSVEQREEQLPELPQTPPERPSISSSLETEDVHARAIEERPTLIGEAVLAGSQEKQVEEQPTQIEKVEVAPIEGQEKKVEEQPTLIGEEAVGVEGVEEQPTLIGEEAVGVEGVEEQPTLIEMPAEPEKGIIEEHLTQEEEPAEPEERVVENQSSQEIVAAELDKGVEEQPTRVEEVVTEPEKEVEEQPGLEGTGAELEKQEEEQLALVESQEKQVEEQPTLIEESAELEQQEEEQPGQEVVAAELEEREEEPQTRQEEVVAATTEREKWVEEQPTLIEMPAEPEKQVIEQPGQEEVEVIGEQRKWVEEQPTLIEMPAVSIESQEKQGVLNMVQLSGYLILRKLNGQEIREYPLNKPVISIGRARDNDVVIPRDKLSSRHHATVRYEHTHYALYDEHSANGTFVNGDEIETAAPYVLRDGDFIGIGAYEFIYRTAEALMQEVDHVSTAKVEAAVGNEIAAYAVRKDLTAQQGKTEEENLAIGEEWVDETPEEITGREKAVSVSTAEPVRANVDSAAKPMESQAKLAHTRETLFERLRFTAFHPKEVAVETWNTLLVYTYIDAALQDIYQDVNLLLHETESGVRRLLNQAAPLLPQGTNITIVPECRGVLFNPRRVTLQWSEDWHRSIFRFSARRELAGLSKNGRINIFAGPLLVGTLRMAMLFEEQEGIDPLIEDAAITTKPYQRIYTSYSHQDKIVMRASQDMYRKFGFDTLLQVDQMRSNQVLSETVRAGIEQAEVFQLFWSEQAAKSEYVQQEWEYALQLNRGEGFMRPVYWEVPLVKPPDSLAPFYFSYLPTYAFASS